MVSMDGKGARKGYASVPAINPVDGNQWDLYISLDKIKVTAKRGTLHAKELAYIVPPILLAPKAIFAGVRDEGDEWLCYAGRPSCSFRGPDGARCVPWPKQVFLVFVNGDRVVYTWRWEKASLENPNLPEEHRTRFGRRVL